MRASDVESVFNPPGRINVLWSLYASDVKASACFDCVYHDWSGRGTRRRCNRVEIWGCKWASWVSGALRGDPRAAGGSCVNWWHMRGGLSDLFGVCMNVMKGAFS